MARKRKPPAGAKPTNVPGIFRLPATKGAPDTRLGTPYFNQATGEKLSRREYLRLYRGVVASNEAYRKTRPPTKQQARSRDLYRQALAEFTETRALETGKRLTKRAAMHEFATVNADLHRWPVRNGKRISTFEARDLARQGRGPLRAGGPLAKALEAIGRRPANATYPVGETPD